MQLPVSQDFVAVPTAAGGYTLVRVLPAAGVQAQRVQPQLAPPAPARNRSGYVQALIRDWPRQRYLTPALLAEAAGNSEQAAYQALRYAESTGLLRRTPKRGWRLR